MDGKFFRLETGEPWTAIECSDFSLYKRYLNGEDIRPVLTQRRDLGFNLLRVWLLNTSVVPGGILPSQYGDFYDRLVPFADLCASYGLYVEFTAFTQTRSLMPSQADQQAHLDRVVGALANQTNVLLELVNEADQHDNATADLPWLAGILSAHGSNGADHEPVRPTWDYELYHTNGLPEWWRKTGHNAMELANESGHPCISNENTRFPDQDDNPNHAYDAAMGASLLCAGACYHSAAGKLSQVWSGRELECAQAWAAGARSVPLEFRTGHYRHRDDLEGPNCIRAYERKLGDGRSYIIKIRP